MPGNPRADARLKQAFEVSAELEKSLEIRSNPNTRQMIIREYPEQNTAYELLYSFYSFMNLKYVYALKSNEP